MTFSWAGLPKPIIGLSAMDGVTDAAMREITKIHGNPDFMVTEFTSADGIVHGVQKLLRDFYYTANQRPIIAQLFGANPTTFYTAAIICCFLGFDGIDINMGCPADSIAKKGGGASLILNPKLAKEIVTAVQRGVVDWTNGIELRTLGLPSEFVVALQKRASNIDHSVRQRLPISVKTRIGYNRPITREWVSRLLEMNLSVITLHGRTLEQQYSGAASWEEIAKGAALAHQTKTLLFGNGDLTKPEQIVERVKQTQVDGVWIGRAAMGNPWIFTQYRSYKDRGIYDEPTIDERFHVALEHAQLFEKLNSTEFANDPYPFLNMRKHLGWYVKGFENATAVRAKLFQANTAVDVEKILSTLT